MKVQIIKFLSYLIGTALYVIENLFVWALRGAGLTIGCAMALSAFGVGG